MRKQIFQRKTQFIDRKSGFIGEKPGFRILLHFTCHKCNLKQNLVYKLRIQKLVPCYAIMVMFSSRSFTGLSISFKCLLDANFRHVKSYSLGGAMAPPDPPLDPRLLHAFTNGKQTLCCNNNNNTFFNVSFTIVRTLIYTNMKQFQRLHYGTY